MNRPTQSAPKVLFAVLLAAGALLVAGCGDDAPPDPQQVIESSFPEEGAPSSAARSAIVEVASLGFDDRVLGTRQLAVDPRTYAQIRAAIAGPRGKGEGLFGLAGDVRTVGTEDLDGTEVDHVTGEFDVEALVAELESATRQSGTTAAALPGLGQLDDLRDQLVSAKFDLYAQSGDGTFEQLDLTLSLDDRDNASPPTRIRFSLTESDPEQALE